MAANADKIQATDSTATIEKGSLTETTYLDEDDIQYRRLLRKIDWRLMPLMCIIYGVQFVDKTTLSYASVMGIKADTHLVGNQYSLLGTMFYIGYLVCPKVIAKERLSERLGLGISYQLLNAKITSG